LTQSAGRKVREAVRPLPATAVSTWRKSEANPSPQESAGLRSESPRECAPQRSAAAGRASHGGTSVASHSGRFTGIRRDSDGRRASAGCRWPASDTLGRVCKPTQRLGCNRPGSRAAADDHRTRTGTKDFRYIAWARVPPFASSSGEGLEEGAFGLRALHQPFQSRRGTSRRVGFVLRRAKRGHPEPVGPVLVNTPRHWPSMGFFSFSREVSAAEHTDKREWEENDE